MSDINERIAAGTIPFASPRNSIVETKIPFLVVTKSEGPDGGGLDDEEQEEQLVSEPDEHEETKPDDVNEEPEVIDKEEVQVQVEVGGNEEVKIVAKEEEEVHAADEAEHEEESERHDAGDDDVSVNETLVEAEIHCETGEDQIEDTNEPDVDDKPEAQSFEHAEEETHDEAQAEEEEESVADEKLLEEPKEEEEETVEHFDKVIDTAFAKVELKSSANVAEFTKVELKPLTNVAELAKLAEEVSEDEKPTVSKLLAWAKSTKKSKTETMVVREKKKLATFRRAVDIDAVPIIVEDRQTTPKVEMVKSTNRTFEVTTLPLVDDEKKNSSSDLSKLANPVTKSWLEHAVRDSEVVGHDVEVLKQTFTRLESGYHSVIFTAKFENGDEKTFHWVIKKVASTLPFDRDAFVVCDFGTKLHRFLKKNVHGVKREATLFPLDSIVYSDNNFSVVENLRGYKVFKDTEGMSLEYLKLALKCLARLHGISFAYFVKGGDDSDKKFLEDQNYQINKKQEVTQKLNASFERLLRVLQDFGPEGVALAEKVQAKFGKKLFDIFRDALQPGSSFSTLCHGFPLENDFYFGFDDVTKKPNDAKVINFHHARLAHPITDVIILLNTSVGPKVVEQSGFLLRFVYFENLSSTLKLFGLESSVDFDTLNKEFKAKTVYGVLAAAMHLAQTATPTATSKATPGRVPGKRSFTSKILGSYSNKTVQEGSKIAKSASLLRVKALIEKIV